MRAAAAEAEGLEAHRLQGAVAGQDHEVGPRELAAVHLLDGPEQTARLVQVAVVGPAVEGGEALLATAGTATAVADAVGARAVPRHADEERAVVAEVGGPPALGLLVHVSYDCIMAVRHGNPSGARFGGVGSGTVRGGARGAHAPVGDLGLVDREAVVVGRGQAGRGAYGAVDIGHVTTRLAHDVVVVVRNPRLITGHGARRLDTAYQTGGRQRLQHVVNGLVGHRAEIRARDTDDLIGVGVRMLVHRCQHGHPGTGDTQSSPA